MIFDDFAKLVNHSGVDTIGIDDMAKTQICL